MPKAIIGNILIKKRTVTEWLTLFIVIMPFLLSFFLDFLSLPGVLRHTIDVAWITVFVALFVRRRILMDRRVAPFIIFITILVLFWIVTYLFNFESPFYFLWGFRNNVRVYVAFLAFVLVLDAGDIKTVLKLFDVLFWINAAVTFFQFFVLGYSWDYLGGLFGVGVGCNAYSAVFLAFIISKSILRFMAGNESALSCFSKCGVSLIIAALAELKFFFVVFVIVLLLATVLTKFSWRKFAVLLVSAILVSLSGSILTAVFGSEESLSFERIVELVTATNYATSEDLGRFTAIPTIANTILIDLPSKLFGMGLGNCDTSAIPLFNTPFYQVHSSMHYTWFSSAFIFLENGYIGLILNLSFFAMCYSLSKKRMKNGQGNVLFCQLGMIFSVLCVLLTFYNASLRTEVGYLVYFALALSFVENDEEVLAGL